MVEAKFILGGGFANKASDGGQSFYNEATKSIPPNSNVLIIPFAASEQDLEAEVIKNRDRLRTFAAHKSFIINRAELNTLRDQIAAADLIWISGGSAEKLMSEVGVLFSRLNLENKTVVGVSAGAYLLSDYYLNVGSNGEISFKAGTGILPIKTVTHYRSAFYEEKYPGVFSWDQVDAEIRKIQPHTQEVLLREGEYAVFSQ